MQGAAWDSAHHVANFVHLVLDACQLVIVRGTARASETGAKQRVPAVAPHTSRASALCPPGRFQNCFSRGRRRRRQSPRRVVERHPWASVLFVTDSSLLGYARTSYWIAPASSWQLIPPSPRNREYTPKRDCATRDMQHEQASATPTWGRCAPAASRCSQARSRPRQCSQGGRG